jgi:hypothetical protein
METDAQKALVLLGGKRCQRRSVCLDGGMFRPRVAWEVGCTG